MTFKEFYEKKYGEPYPASSESLGESLSVIFPRFAETMVEYTDYLMNYCQALHKRVY